MFVRRTVLMACLGLAATGCSKKAVAPAADAPSADAAPAATATAPPTVVTRNIERYQVRASIEGISHMFAGADKMAGWFPEDEPVNARASFEAALLQTGFGPGFLANIDLDGLHAASIEYPHAGQPASADDSRFAAVLAVVDSRKVIENMPASMRPQPLGGGLWEMVAEDVRVVLREQAKWVELAFHPDDLDRAAEIPKSHKPGRRLRAAVSNLPPDDMDPSDLLGLPPESRVAKQFKEITQNLEEVQLEIDFGDDRDFQVYGAARAPFAKLGLDPIGAPRTAATALESRLPDEPVLVGTLSWGDPALLHKAIDREARLDRIPDPLRDMATRAMTHVHATLDQVASDVVLGIYLTPKGQAALVLAADVKEDPRALSAMRGLNEIIHEALKSQSRLASEDPASRFTVSYKPEGLRFSGASADHFSISVPKSMQDDARKLGPFIGKNRLEVVSMVHDGTALVAIGAGGRKVAAEIARGPGTRSLASDPGLEAVRAGVSGCQLCLTGDVQELLRLRFLLLQATADDKAQKKAIKSALSRLAKVKSQGAPGLGLSVEAKQATAVMAVPRDLLFATRADAQALIELFQLADRDGRPTPL